MPALTWKPEYSVHVRHLDRQHRRILDVVNELYAEAGRATSVVTVDSVLTRLRDYIKEHFSAEEAYLKEHGYPGYEEQKREHDRFIDRVCEFQKDYLKAGKIASINLFNFVWDWFAGHIVKADKQYDRYLSEWGAAPSRPSRAAPGSQ